jgi:hypothetical protein
LLIVTEQKASKLNRLERGLPEGLVVDAAWLEKRDISSNLRAYYVKSGWLEQPSRGLYRRARGTLGWQQVVISLQTLLEQPFHVGGRTSLELQGFAHYLTFARHSVHLYGPHKPPGWLGKLELPQTFIYHNSATLFRNDPVTKASTSLARDLEKDTGRNLTRFEGGDLTRLSWGQWDWPLTLSVPERAYLELLDELPRRESFQQADVLMQAASNFSPRRLQKLLSDCASIKVKRLFFFFADRHQHAWRKRLDKDAIHLGRGKRMLVRGGRLDPVYLITVPEDLDAVS